MCLCKGQRETHRFDCEDVAGVYRKRGRGRWREEEVDRERHRLDGEDAARSVREPSRLGAKPDGQRLTSSRLLLAWRPLYLIGEGCVEGSVQGTARGLLYPPLETRSSPHRRGRCPG